MTRFPLTITKSLFLSFSVSAISIWLSIQNQDWLWFSRSGSLIVVIGILLTSTQIIENSRKLQARRRSNENNFSRDFAGDIKKQTLEHLRYNHEDMWKHSLNGLYLLIIGTIIWGYGDLLGILFN